MPSDLTAVSFGIRHIHYDRWAELDGKKAKGEVLPLILGPHGIEFADTIRNFEAGLYNS